MTPTLEEGPVSSTSAKPAPETSKAKPKGPQKKKNGPKSHQCLQYGQDSYGIQSQRAGKDQKDLLMRKIQEIQLLKSSIDVELGKFVAKLNKITSGISELKRNEKNSTEWYKLTHVKLDSITNKCDRIASKFQVQNYEIEDLSILNINDKLSVLKYYVLEILNNTNQFATPLAESDSERQKLRNGIIANVEKIHKNYESNMPRHSTSFTEEKFL
ncbi:hypothetical protein O181_097104 [Austropuccinia psidii MF-1]|uniref:Uncharacterized protein n=1 Tax=Austropuccinia psidii MF-1 TaxID=1389203 RepID=A0A9Q3PDA5_9BASI|nr:hypothetical protein [Austropuccinia psidii MF-1]